MPLRAREILRPQTLSQQFMLASLVILLAGMAGIGAWVGRQVEAGVIRHTGATAAVFIDSFVAPSLQALGNSWELPPGNVNRLNSLLQNSPLGQQIVAFKVWDTRGRLLYSSDPSAIGKTFPMHAGMLRARLGEVVSTISPLDEDENADLGAVYDQLLETYSPVWLSGTDQIIAVAEFYLSTDELKSETGALKRRTWLVIGAAGLLIYLLLAGFVRRASDTITRQQSELGVQVAQLTNLLAQNRELNERVRRAAGSVALLNESYLRRIGSELHDGPAQDLGLSLLKLDDVVGRAEAHPQEPLGTRLMGQLTGIQASLQNALKEMRGIAAGLSLPELAGLGLPETIVRAVRSHERQTGTRVSLELGPLPETAGLPVKITVYRVIQEALNNAYRHAGGVGQAVQVLSQAGQLEVEVSDQGPGFQPDESSQWDGHLGLGGMRERVESLGGSFAIESQPGQGARIRASLPLEIKGG